MVYIENNKLVSDIFIVTNRAGNPVTGLIKGDFTIKLFDPDNYDVADISGGVSIDFEEIIDGFYKISFTPISLGLWTLIVYHSTHFPWGKGQTYKSIDSLVGGTIKDLIERILGLSQENYRIFNQQYDRNNNLISGLIKLYSSADDCENDNNPFAQYQMLATFNRRNQLTGYKVKKVS